jgi:lipopolysaccharide transport system ATP-binding protein
MGHAIRVEGVSKKYRIGHVEVPGAHTLRDDLMRLASWPVRRLLRREPSGGTEDFWALKDVSFEVPEGKVVGVVGRNGAGKSTLFKVLSRITRPTVGRVVIRGRLGSLLEVGTGFHPELTGRENVFLNGAILGMTLPEIRRKFDEIVAFAEIEQFLDTPVKRYSSGMYVRLAFAVAAHLEPEILLLDEVLAVGDAGFQKKCLAKIGDVARSGRTILFVSHNMSAVNRLCERAILLDKGQIALAGRASEVTERYLTLGLGRIRGTPLAERKDRQGDGRLRLIGLHYEDADGNGVPALACGQEGCLVLEYVCTDGRDRGEAVASFVVKDMNGQALLHFRTNFTGENFARLPPRGQIICRVPHFPLAAGSYLVNAFVGTEAGPWDMLVDAGELEVCDGDFYGTGVPGQPAICKVLTPARWQLRA